MRIGVWYGHDTVMQGVSQYITHCCQMVMQTYDLQREMYFLSDPAMSLILMIEVLGI